MRFTHTQNVYPFKGKLGELTTRAKAGKSEDVDYIMNQLLSFSNLAITRFVDYALSLVNTTEGFERIKDYLFSGTLVQRNYASLYFNRLGEWEIVNRAYEKGLIDDIQAFAR